MSDLGCVLAILLLFFLFTGEPDVWDRLHEHVMTELEVEDEELHTREEADEEHD